ncbi:MAG TPA: zf-HC2 domain-containing protein [Gemmatimonadaceae bacterium]|nr:zf-HC2 domain-containing protein [Gemmatimonadaceae bacterium]
MIDCPNGDVRDLLPDFLHGRLDVSRRAEVERHLAGCEACRDELSLLRDLRATMDRVPRVRVDAIAAAIPPYRVPVRRSWATSWRTAAAIAAIAVGGTSIALLRDSGSDVARSATPGAGAEAESSPDRSSGGVVAAAPSSGSAARTSASVERAAPAPASTPGDRGELAMAGGTIGELSDGELSALVEGIESLEALPSAEAESVEPLAAGVQEEVR